VQLAGRVPPALALNQGLDRADVQAIRERRLPEQQRYAALSRLAKALIENRGQVSGDDFDTFRGIFRLIEQDFTAQKMTGGLTLRVGVTSSTSDLWQPRQRLNSVADRLKLVMAVKRVHVN
jgi:hypothetical protein